MPEASFIPRPKHIEFLGGYLEVDGRLKVMFEDLSEHRQAVEGVFSELTGLSLGGEVPLRVGRATVVEAGEAGRREAYTISVDDGVYIGAGGFKGVLNALATLGQLYDPATGSLPRVTVRDWPSFQYRGVVEGFYGRPWSWEDRLSIIRFMAAVKMNAYIYAPKDDPYHRDKWRLRYPEELYSEIGRLAEAASRYGVEFVFAVSPGLSAVYSSESDRNRLVEKFLHVARLGVRSFGIFYDDIPEQLIHEEDRRAYSSLAEAHADFTNSVLERLREELGSVTMIVTPTEYRGVEMGSYFRDLARRLDPGVYLMWTGPLVCSPSIGLRVATGVAGIAGERLLVWDNYPVNDYARNRLNLGPLRGRDGELASVIKGFFFNPMNEAHASKIPLATAADYTWNPEQYDADRSIRAALRMLLGDRYEDGAFLIAQLGESTLWPREPAEAALAENLEARLGEAEAYFSRLETLYGSLRAADGGLYMDLEPYLYKLHLYGRAGLEGLRAYRASSTPEAWIHLATMVRLWDHARGLQEIAGCTSRHEEPMWFTRIQRCFLDELLTRLAWLVARKWGLAIDVPRITSNTDHVAGHDVSKAFRGGLFISRTVARGVEAVEFEYPEPRRVEYLELRQPATSIEAVGLAEYVVKITSGGEWREVGRVATGSLPIGEAVKAIRLELLKPAPGKPVVLGVEVKGRGPRALTNIESMCSIANVLDGRADTFFEVESGREGGWIVLDLGEVRRVSRVRILQDPEMYVPLNVYVASEKMPYPVASLEYMEWIPVGRASSPYSEIEVGRATSHVKVELAGSGRRGRIIQIQVL